MKNKFLYSLTILILSFVVISNTFAGPRNKYGQSSARELLIPVGSISTSLGGSNLASTSGVDALHWNPSGLASLNTRTGEVLFSNQRFIADININYFAGAYKLGNIGTIGAFVKAFDFGDIEVTTVNNPDGTGEIYSPTILTTGLSFARAMTDRINFGTTVKFIYNKISRETGSTFALDFGLQYNVVGSGLQFGVALKNLGPSMTFTGPDLEQFFQPPGTPPGTNTEPRAIILGDFELPTALSLGLSYNFNLDRTNNLMLHGTFQNNSYSFDDYNFGLEYNYNKMVFLRGGYSANNMDSDDKVFTGPTFGAGFRTNLGTANLGFDYAFRVTDKFDNNQFFTLNIGF
jgi:hypothetical protein